MDFAALKIADAALGIDDPVQAAAALNAQTVTVTVDVPLTEARAVLWPTLEYSGLVLLSEVRDYTNIPKQVVQLAITAVSLLDSGRTIYASQTSDWLALMGGLSTLQAVAPISQASIDAIGAKRTATQPKWPETVTAGHMQTARNQP